MKYYLIVLLSLLVGCASKNKLSTKEKLTFDHTYTVIENENDFFSLKKRGFILEEQKVTHPGPIDCRFIKFYPESYPFFQYLEWGYTPNFEKMKKRVAGTEEGVSTRNGIGFRTYGDIDEIFKSIEPEFKQFEIFSFHKNFDWKKNSKDRLPGWDFIGFKKELISGLNLFGIKYGNPGKKAKAKKKEHPNSAFKIIGVILDLDDSELKNFSTFTRNGVEKGIITNDYGFNVIQYKKLKDRSKFFNKKKTKYKAVILKIRNKALFEKYAKPDYHFTFAGQHFYGIRTKDKSWDILATMSEGFVDRIKKDLSSK